MIPAAGGRPVGVILIVALLSACETSATAAPTVRVIDSAGNARQWHFDPTSISIKVGETITSTNTGTEFHTVTADDNAAFDSGVVNAGDSYKRIFPTAGKFGYHCTFHPWMTGTVNVR